MSGETFASDWHLYDPAKDGRRNYDLSCLAQREMRFRMGLSWPTTEEQMRWRQEGPRPWGELDSVRNWKGEDE